MRRRGAGVALLVALVVPRVGGAQPRQPDTVLSLEADWVGAAVNYARARGPARYWGAEVGVGGGFWNRMLVAGRHFAHEDGPSYQPRDGYVDKELVEILHLSAFLRNAPSERVSWDVGARASAFIHFDSSDDDPGIPLFFGAFANLRVGNRWVKVGPTLLVGLFTEGSLAREFGVFLVPLSGRVSFGW